MTADAAGVYFTVDGSAGFGTGIVTAAARMWNPAYDAFGNVLAGLNSDSGHYTFDSYDFDAATGYYDNDARIYDPASGRWLSQDPMGFDAGDSNLYRYVNNAPTSATDPSGLEGPSGMQEIDATNPTPNGVFPFRGRGRAAPGFGQGSEFAPDPFNPLGSFSPPSGQGVPSRLQAAQPGPQGLSRSVGQEAKFQEFLQGGFFSGSAKPDKNGIGVVAEFAYAPLLKDKGKAIVFLQVVTKSIKIAGGVTSAVIAGDKDDQKYYQSFSTGLNTGDGLDHLMGEKSPVLQRNL